MPQFALLCPTEDELADAQEGLEQILDLSEVGEVDLPPYLVRLLLQLQEILAATIPQPTARPAPVRSRVAAAP